MPNTLENEQIAEPDDAAAPAPALPQRCGLIAIVGKPNVGKSTLLNALVGQKISIVSRKAQTTRHRIQGVRTLAHCQYVFADTPGFQTRHSTALNKTLNKAVTSSLSDVDAVLWVVESGRVNRADLAVAALIGEKTPCIVVANKIDRLNDRRELLQWLPGMQQHRPHDEIVPICAKTPKDVAHLLDTLAKYLPEQPWWYSEDELSDKSERFLAAELIREKLFRLTGDEIPYTTTVVIDEFKESVGKTAARYFEIAPTIIVGRDSHKAMVIGDKGDKLKRIGTEAREELQTLMDCKMHLTLWVKVKSGWADNAAAVKSYGYG